ncbi:MAG: hypothetical protein IJG00_01325 [Clostridia bacterium]|nr:hypothetical protein [Clostridia bacterium]
MKKLVKKILVSSFVGASMFLFSNVAFAQNYILNVAFVGESVEDTVKNIFFNSNTSTPDGPYTWGIHVLDNQEDVFLYRFRKINLDVNNNIDKEIISESDIVFMVVDFSKPEKIRERIYDYIGETRSNIAETNNNNKKMVLICKGIKDEQQWLKTLDSIKFMQNVESDASGNFVKRDVFDFLIIKNGADIRESFFEIEKKLGDLNSSKLIHTEALPMSVNSFLQIFKNSNQIIELKNQANDNSKRIATLELEVMNIRQEFREELNQLGNDSWKILEKVVSIFSRDGHMDPKGCQEVINEIRNISAQYGTFQDAYNAFKNDVNEQIVQFEHANNEFGGAIHEALESLSRRQDANEQLMDNNLENIRFAIEETRKKLNEKVSEAHQAIFNQEKHIREIDQQTTTQVAGVLGRVEAMSPIIESITVLQGQYEEFRDDINRKVNGMPDDIKAKIRAALEIGEGSTSWWSRFWGKSELHAAIKYLKKK